MLALWKEAGFSKRFSQLCAACVVCPHVAARPTKKHTALSTRSYWAGVGIKLSAVMMNAAMASNA